MDTSRTFNSFTEEQEAWDQHWQQQWDEGDVEAVTEEKDEPRSKWRRQDHRPHPRRQGRALRPREALRKTALRLASPTPATSTCDWQTSSPRPQRVERLCGKPRRRSVSPGSECTGSLTHLRVETSTAVIGTASSHRSGTGRTTLTATSSDALSGTVMTPSFSR